MSDSSPLLMEMGSQLSGYGSALPTQSGQTAEGAEFSGVLQSVLQKGAQKPDTTGLAQENILQAELLAQSLVAAGNEGSIMTLSQQTTTEILPLPGGNSLPLTDLAEPSLGLFALQGMTESDGLTAGAAEADMKLDMFNGGEDKNTKTSPQMPLTADELNQLRRDQQGLIDDVAMQDNIDKEILTDMNKAATGQSNPLQSENPVLQQTTKSLNNSSEKTATSPLDELRAVRTELDVDKGEQLASDALSKQQPFETALQRTNGAALNADSVPVQAGVEANTAATTVSTATDASAARANAGTALNGALGGATAYAALSNTAPNPTIQHVGPTIATLTIPPENPAWSSFVGERVQWMAGQDIQQAHIKLNPPELGALEINVQVGQDKQTTVSFSSPHAQVRDALEAAAPRLREMFGDNGLSLGDVNVSHQSMSQQQHAQRDETAANLLQNKRKGLTNDAAVIVSPSESISQGNGMLDLYA